MEKTRNPNLSNVLLKAWVSDAWIALKTYDRRHGTRGRFLIDTDALREWLTASRTRSFCETDCGNLLRIWDCDGTLHLDLRWLSEYGNGELRGFRQTLEVSQDDLRRLVQDGVPIHQLCKPASRQAVIDSSAAGKTIREILQKRTLRRAFSKAMRDCFHWRNEVVRLYPDGKNSFYFTTQSGCPSCGGLILHESTVHTPCGEYLRVTYSIHT